MDVASILSSDTFASVLKVNLTKDRPHNNLLSLVVEKVLNARLVDKLTRGRWFSSGHTLCPFMPAHSSDTVLPLLHAGLLMALD